jgi:hypothetical protein
VHQIRDLVVRERPSGNHARIVQIKIFAMHPDEPTNFFRQLQPASYLKPEWLPLYVQWGSNRLYLGRPRGVWK